MLKESLFVIFIFNCELVIRSFLLFFLLFVFCLSVTTFAASHENCFFRFASHFFVLASSNSYDAFEGDSFSDITVLIFFFDFLVMKKEKKCPEQLLFVEQWYNPSLFSLFDWFIDYNSKEQCGSESVGCPFSNIMVLFLTSFIIHYTVCFIFGYRHSMM
jgi:hypothetical protein